MRRPRLRWVAFAVAGIAALLLATYFVFPQVFIVAMMRIQFPRRETPELYRIPIDRDLEVATVDANLVRAFDRNGLRFTTPWGEPLQERQLGETTAFGFDGGISVTVFGRVQPLTESLKWFAAAEDDGVETIETVFGEDIFRSDYVLYSRTLNTTPDRLGIFSSREEAAAASILLLLKAMGMVTWDGDIYSLSTESMKGFHYGMPGNPHGVFVRLFDRDDRPMEMLFRGDITLSEFDFVLASVHRTHATGP